MRATDQGIVLFIVDNLFLRTVHSDGVKLPMDMWNLFTVVSVAVLLPGRSCMYILAERESIAHVLRVAGFVHSLSHLFGPTNKTQHNKRWGRLGNYRFNGDWC